MTNLSALLIISEKGSYVPELGSGFDVAGFMAGMC